MFFSKIRMGKVQRRAQGLLCALAQVTPAPLRSRQTPGPALASPPSFLSADPAGVTAWWAWRLFELVLSSHLLVERVV